MEKGAGTKTSEIIAPSGTASNRASVSLSVPIREIRGSISESREQAADRTEDMDPSDLVPEIRIIRG